MKYDFQEVDFQLLIIHMGLQGITLPMIAENIGGKINTVQDWKRGRSKPRNRDLADKLIEYAEQYIPSKKMRQCGVVYED